MTAGDRAGRLAVLHKCHTWLHATENWIDTQVRFLPERIEPHVLCQETKNLDLFPLPHIHCRADQGLHGYLFRYGLVRLRIRRRPAFFSWVAERSGARLLHSHFGPEGWGALQSARNAGLRHVVTFYGFDLSLLPQTEPVWREHYREMFDRIDGVLCEGSHMARRIVELGCHESKVRVHHLGVILDRIPYEPRRWDRSQPLRVLMAASFVEKKGLPFAIEALGRIRSKAPLEITVIGDASPRPDAQPEKARILDAVDRSGLRSCVRFLGYQPLSVLHAEAARHHIFLSPSVTASNGDTEGGAPVIIIEMAASGMAIVSTTHCDIPEVVLDGETGLLAPERDVAGLVDRLEWLIDHPGEWEPMLAAGRRRIEQEYNARVQGERLATFYEQIANHDPTGGF